MNKFEPILLSIPIGRFMISGLIKILNHMVFITKSLFQRDIFEITFFVNNILSIYNSDIYLYIYLRIIFILIHS
jgi:hypothetical protein